MRRLIPRAELRQRSVALRDTLSRLRSVRASTQAIEPPPARPPLSAFAAIGARVDLPPSVEVPAPERVHLGDDVSVGDHSVLAVAGEGRLRIGDRVRMGRCTAILCAESVTIADDAVLGDHVSVVDAWSPPRPGSTPPPGGPVTVGARVRLGTNVAICPGVTVGDGAYVAPGAVVTDDVAPGATVIGNPAAAAVSPARVS